MKAERRHKLQNNTLAQIISDLPTFWNDYGSKVALWGALGILLVIVVYYRFGGRSTANLQDLQSLASLRERVDMLRFNPGQDQAALTPQMYQMDNSSAGEVLADLKRLSDSSSDPRIKAEALVEMGDVEWNLANLPVGSPADSTQVDFPAARNDLLASARGDYQQVVDKYSDQPLSYVTARFGLAAIAESAHDYAAAREQYDAIGKTYNVDPLLKQQAAVRLQTLADLQRGIYIGQAQTYAPYVLPDTIRLPSSRWSTTMSATGPATTIALPEMPSTMPTTSVSVTVPMPVATPVPVIPATTPAAPSTLPQ